MPALGGGGGHSNVSEHISSASEPENKRSFFVCQAEVLATRGQQGLEHLGRCLPWAPQEDKQALSSDRA